MTYSFRTAPPRTAGYTLMEFTVALGVLTLLTAVLVSTVVVDLRTRAGAMREREATMDASGGLAAIEAHLRSATAILASATIDGQTYTTGATAIAFEIPTVDGAGTVLATRDRIGVARDPAHPERLVIAIAPATSSHLPAGHRIVARRVTNFQIRYAAVAPTTAHLTHLLLVSTVTDTRGTAAVTHGLAVPLRNSGG